jgi:hypothetical protein
MHEHITPNNNKTQGQSTADQIKEFGGTDLLDAGLRAIARGWKVFPCNGQKRPLTPNGCYDGTTDEQQIRSWAKRWPGALWAYALPEGIAVIDLHMKRHNNGIREFENLQHCKPDEFEAPRVRTASGGMHLYTNANGQDFKNSVSKIAPGIDTRSLGGYVIIPSGPDSGYRWLSDPNTPAPHTPEWVEVVLRRPSSFESNCEPRPFQGFSVFGDTMLASACDAITMAADGTQEKTLNDRSYQIGRYVGGGLLERDATVDTLVRAGVRMKDYDPAWEWTEEEVRFKIERAVDAGKLKPLDDGTEADRRAQELMDRLSNDPQYVKQVEDILEAEDAKRAAEQAAEQPQQDPPRQDPPKQEQSRQKERQKKQFPDVLDAGDDLELPPPRQWLLGNIFCRKFLSSLFGDGGVGKTALRYTQYLSLATGRSLTGEHVFQRCRVLIISFEDDLDELRRRIWAIRLHYKITQEEVKGRLFLWSAKAQDGKLMVLDSQGNPRLGNLKVSIETLIAQLNLDLIGIDPFIKSHGVGENNNTAIDMVAQVLTDMCAEHNIAVDIPHHVSKAKGADNEPGDANRGRGASALKDAARLVYTLNVMAKEEAEKFGINEEDRFAYVRMDKGKVNITPPSRKAIWFHLVGVPIGNGSEMYKHGDEVQVVESWTPPDVMFGLSNAQAVEILNEIDDGMEDGRRYTHVSSAKTRAAWKAVVDVEPKLNEKQAREIIKTWMKEKVLVSKTYRNEKDRKDEEGLWRKGVDDNVPF